MAATVDTGSCNVDCLCGIEGTQKVLHVIACKQCAVVQHSACVLNYGRTGRKKRPTTEELDGYICQTCDPERHRELLSAIAHRRPTYVVILETFLEPHMWRRYCAIEALPSTPPEVARRAVLKESGEPVKPEPVGFKRRWKAGLKLFTDMLTDVELTKLHGRMLVGGHTKMLALVKEDLARLARKRHLPIHKLKLFAEIMDLARKGAYWSGKG